MIKMKIVRSNKSTNCPQCFPDGKITNEYIKKNFNILDEKKKVKRRSKVGSIDEFYSYDPEFTVEELIKILSRFKKGDIVEFSGAVCAEVYSSIDDLESDFEVIKRLKLKVSSKRAEERAKEKRRNKLKELKEEFKDEQD